MALCSHHILNVHQKLQTTYSKQNWHQYNVKGSRQLFLKLNCTKHRESFVWSMHLKHIICINLTDNHFPNKRLDQSSRSGLSRRLARKILALLEDLERNWNKDLNTHLSTRDQTFLSKLEVFHYGISGLGLQWQESPVLEGSYPGPTKYLSILLEVHTNKAKFLKGYNLPKITARARLHGFIFTG